RAYAIDVEDGDGAGPGRLEEIEERLAMFARLERKHGGSIEEVLRHADRCRARVQELERAEVDLEAAEQEVASAAAELDRLADREAAPLLVFDEIDAGIGGHTARAVGEHLRALAATRQILCITHLPQVAALASRHFTIAKDSTTVPATTRVTALEGDGVVGEL